MKNLPQLSVIGLGKLGACTAACFAAKGFQVLGMDIQKRAVDLVNQGKAPVIEPRLQELITKAGKRLRATQNYEEVIANSDVTFLITPTPSKPDGSFSALYLQNALEPLASSLKEQKKDYHLFVVVSTVSPGTIEEVLIPLIEKYSGKKLNQGFGVAYNPEFIALGNVINGFLNPDLVLFGESDLSVGDQLEQIYKKTCENDPFIAKVSIVSAEIAKISLNAYITMKISFANTLSNICERIPNANVDDITKSLGSDKRISPYYLRGGLAFGGPCFPRDGRAFIAFAKKYGVDAKLAKATDEVNQFQINHLVKKVLDYSPLKTKKPVAVLGLAYKNTTPVIEESAGIQVVAELLKKEVPVIVYDPLAMGNAKEVFGSKISYASSVKECFRGADICVVTTPEEEFKKIKPSDIIHNPTILIDCWRILEAEKLGSKVQYIGMGRFTS